MMSDLLPAHKRGTAFGKMQFAGSIGSLLGGALSTVTSELMVFGVWRGWRLCFVIVAVVSLALAPAICVFLTEPARGGAADDCTVDAAAVGCTSADVSGESVPLRNPVSIHRQRRRQHLGLCSQIQVLLSVSVFLSISDSLFDSL